MEFRQNRTTPKQNIPYQRWIRDNYLMFGDSDVTREKKYSDWVTKGIAFGRI